MGWTTSVRWLGLTGLVACGEAVDDSGTEEPFAFDDLSDEDKAAYMASDVLPRMQEVFQAYDSEAYADFSCATCHVTGLSDGTYVMPDPGLPQLRDDAFPYESDIGVFMADEVLPELQALLGPKEGGRPCVSCHTLEE